MTTYSSVPVKHAGGDGSQNTLQPMKSSTPNKKATAILPEPKKPKMQTVYQ